jgi:hypothetical protein
MVSLAIRLFRRKAALTPSADTASAPPIASLRAAFARAGRGAAGEVYPSSNHA